MKVRCISNRGADLPPDGRDPRAGIDEDTVFLPTVGREYAVYAFIVERNYPWYYLCDDNYSYYPVWRPAPPSSMSSTITSLKGGFTPIDGARRRLGMTRPLDAHLASTYARRQSRRPAG